MQSQQKIKKEKISIILINNAIYVRKNYCMKTISSEINSANYVCFINFDTEKVY